MPIFSSVLLALAIATPTVAASAPAEKQAFSKLSVVEGFELNIDTASISFVGTEARPMVALDTQVIMAIGRKVRTDGKLSKVYLNSVIVDCKGDVVYVIKNRVFAADGELLFTSPTPTIAQNPHSEASPVSLLIEFICSPLERLEQDRNRSPSLVTKNPTI